MDAALRLCAEQGPDAPALAEIIGAAGQRNASAIQYHFGSRDGLLEAVLRPYGERVRAARAAIDATGIPVVLTARAEALLLGLGTPLRDVIDRLVAFATAGADCLYAPGLRDPGDIAAVVKAVAPKPVNVLALGPGFSVRPLEDLGVRRVSVGGGLARAAWGGLARAAREIAETGTFDSLAQGLAFKDLNEMFQTGGA